MVDLVKVLDRADGLRRDVTVATKDLHRPNDAHVLVLRDALGLARLVVRAVEPLAHVDVPGAIANFVPDVRGRRGHVMDGANDLDLTVS